MDLIFASNNKHKLEQIKLLLNNDHILMPSDFGIDNYEVVEDGQTLKENAYKKAHGIYKITGKNVFSDDTGLFVNALDGAPGVHSHRYASENPTDKENRNRLLKDLESQNDRSAYFATVICFIDENGKDYYFEGKLLGHIYKTELGDGGFGYDKIFYADEYNKTLGQMDIDFKNKISHRGKAIAKFKEFLGENYESISHKWYSLDV